MPRSIETYEQAIEFLYGRINYERLHGDRFGVGDFKLDGITRLLGQLDHPHRRLPVIHVAGSKGKGSTAAMIAAGLTASGHSTGLFTSPHVESFEERMLVDGQRPSREEIVGLVNEIAEAVRELEGEPGPLSPTYFEMATAMAWQYFTACRTAVGVLEVGLGGRLDATNVCHPLCCVITSISRDHTRLLGSDLASIAAEKAGIIKPGVPVVSGVGAASGAARASGVIAATCHRLDAPLWRLGREIRWTHDRGSHSVLVETPRRRWPRIAVPLPGVHQAANTAIAAAALDVADEAGREVSPSEAAGGIAAVDWPVRIEVVGRRPTVIVDAAHSWASIQALLATLEADFPARRRVLVFATSRDKDVAGLLRQLLPRFDTTILTRFLDNPRAVAVEDLYRRASDVYPVPVHVAADPAAAWKLARRLAGPDDLVCVTGSFFIAAELRELAVEPQHPRPAHTAESVGVRDETRPGD